VRLLVTKYNVNYNEHENDGWNCLTFGAFLGSEALVEYLLTLPHIDIGIALHRAEQRGHSTIVARIQRYIDEHKEGQDFSMAYSMKATERTTGKPAEPEAPAAVLEAPKEVAAPAPEEPAPVVEAPKEDPPAVVEAPKEDAPAVVEAPKEDPPAVVEAPKETPPAPKKDDSAAAAARRKQEAADTALAAAEAAEKKAKEAAAARVANANDFKAAKAGASKDKPKGKTLFGWLFGNK
jgi:outer membrane biosynthesis protein TonB